VVQLTQGYANPEHITQGNNMKLSKILNNKKMSSAKKLAKITETVKSCRKKYGNTDLEVEAPEVNTINGVESMDYLSDDDKLALAGSCITQIRHEAIEEVKTNPLAILDEEVIALIATSPVLTNLSSTNSASDIL